MSKTHQKTPEQQAFCDSIVKPKKKPVKEPKPPRAPTVKENKPRKKRVYKTPAWKLIMDSIPDE